MRQDIAEEAKGFASPFIQSLNCHQLLHLDQKEDY
jgi:hypothetical protein